MLTPSPLGIDRVLVICSPKKDNTEALEQFYESVIWSEFSARDLTLVEISQSTVSSVVGDNDSDVRRKITTARHHDYGNELRYRADCKSDLEFVLIGKDRGVKKRWESSVPQEELFQIIDAMPMRRYEMQQRGKN
jgi:hypothetical protein